MRAACSSTERPPVAVLLPHSDCKAADHRVIKLMTGHQPAGIVLKKNILKQRSAVLTDIKTPCMFYPRYQLDGSVQALHDKCEL